MPWSILGIAFLSGLVGVFGVRWLGRKVGAVVQPREDRWHHQATPYLGGVGIFIGFLIALLASGKITELDWGIVIAGSIAFFLGLADDIWDLSPQTKLVGLFIAAIIVVVFGNITAFFPSSFANILISIFWLVGIANAVNLLDNMDGLAAGTVIIASGFMAYFFYLAGNTEFVILSLAVSGATLGFWVFNFPPASIFMGDSGSLFLGITMASLAIAREPQASNVFAILGIPTLIFLLPILDTTMVSVTRILRGQSPAKGGRDHTSHRLIALGLSERQTLLVLMGIGLISGISAVMIESINYYLSLALIPLVVLIFSLFSAYLGKIRFVENKGSEQKPKNLFIRLVADLTYRRRILEVVLDFFLIIFAYYLAFIVHLGLPIGEVQINQFIETVPIALAAIYFAFFVAGIYRGVWQYFSMEDGFRYLLSILAGIVLSALVIGRMIGFDVFPRGVLIDFGLLLFLIILGSRFFFRFMDRIMEPSGSGRENQVLIYGAGGGGVMALREILQNKDLNYKPVGFLDDDPILRGRSIQGLNVIGGFNNIELVLEQQSVEGVIIASKAIEKGILFPQINEICKEQGVWVRVLRLDFEPIEAQKIR